MNPESFLAKLVLIKRLSFPIVDSGMTKKSKKPKEWLINSVLDDLKDGTVDPSVNEPSENHENENPKGRFNATKIINRSGGPSKNDDVTVSINQAAADKTTILAPASSSAEPAPVAMVEPKMETKIVTPAQSQRASAYEAQFLQAENLKIAQQRIIELERDIERLRKESEILSSANEIAKNKIEDLLAKVQSIEKQKFELKETNESELQIFKYGLIAKDNEIQRLRIKVEELEGRLANDLRKIRVRERELENRLELSKLEKTALMRTKDETILELKRRSESLEGDVESFQHKIIELNQKIEGNQDQFSRTVRALRIALTNLEVNENTSSITLAPLKKAQ